MSFSSIRQPLGGFRQSIRRVVPVPFVARPQSAQAEAAPKKGRGRTRKRSFERRHLRLDIVKKYGQMAAEHEKAAAERGLGMELCAAAVVERTPVVMPELPEWKREFMELQESLAYYKMYDWPEGIGPPHPSTYETEQEDTDGLPYGLPFELAPRITSADRANDVQSMERSLDKSLYLVLKVQSSGGAPPRWTFPQTTPGDGEMLGQAAERAISETVETPRLVHYPRQPFGFFIHPYDEATAAKRNIYGAKIFFYAAQVIDPYEVNRDPKIPDDMSGVSALPGSGVGDWAWLRKDELAEHMDSTVGEYLEHLLN